MSVTALQMAQLMPDARQLESDEPEMESTLHYQQLALLVSSLEWRWQALERGSGTLSGRREWPVALL
ncbi:MAG: hypothetical protein QG599_2668 [Pseudomonadota bacterium]|nr:hypothetical protein [Pseudomonadota bacterium]